MKRLIPAEKKAPGLCDAGRRREFARELTTEEKFIFDGLMAGIRRTNLLKLDIPVPNGNRIFAKCEFEQLTGSHYDRVYPFLVKILLEGGFTPEKYGLVETSSGNASISFARACNAFGYESWAVLPRSEEISAARIKLTSDEGTHIVHPNPLVDGYGLPGIAKRMLRLIRESRDWKKPLWSPDHSRVHDSIESILSLAQEIADELDSIDFFVGIPGNGTTLYGVGVPLKSAFHGMQVVAVEPYSNPGLFLLMHPEMKNIYMAKGDLPEIAPSPDSIHEYKIRMPGSGCYGLADIFPHIVASVPFVDSIRQIDDKNAEWEKPMHAGKSVNDLLLEAHGFKVGSTSAASLMVALEIAERVHDKTIVMIFYDKLEGRY